MKDKRADARSNTALCTELHISNMQKAVGCLACVVAYNGMYRGKVIPKIRTYQELNTNCRHASPCWLAST